MNIRRGLMALAKMVVTSATGLVNFITNIVRPVKVTCEFSPVQEGSGDPSPDNVRPISGWTGAEIKQSGKNIVDVLNDPLNPDKGWSSSGGGTRALQYSSTENAYYTTTSRRMECIFKSEGTYTVSFYAKRIATSGNATRSGINGRYTNQFSPFVNGYTDEFERYAVTYTVTSGSVFFLLLYDTLYIKDLQIEFGSAATDYEPYTSNQISVTFPAEAGTVYGGTVTLNEDGSADLVVPNASRVYDNEKNILQTVFSFGYYQLSSIPYLSYNWQSPLYCSHYKINGNPGIIGGNNASFWIRGYDYTNVEGFRDFLRQQAQNGTPLCVVWKRATPLTYHFDNIGQLQSFIGTNNIWHNMNGSITAEY